MADEKPTAYIVHSTTGRVRFRFPGHRDNAEFFDAVRRAGATPLRGPARTAAFTTARLGRRKQRQLIDLGELGGPGALLR